MSYLLVDSVSIKEIPWVNFIIWITRVDICDITYAGL